MLTSLDTSSSSSSSTAIGTATQALCAGVNIPQVPSSTPTLGAYNYQAVRIGNALFEVQCYANIAGNDFDSVPGANPEACAASCAAYNEAVPAPALPCTGAVFFANTCYRKNQYSIPQVDLGVRSVRLISANFGYPAINDEMYPLPNIATSTLCVGPSSTAFAYQTVFPQRKVSQIDRYTPANKYEVQCQRRTVGTLAASTLLSACLAAGNTMTCYEDCLRCCQHANENAGGSCAGFSYNPVSQNVCDLYSAVSSTTALAGVNSGRLFGPAGYLNATDRP